MKKADLQVKQKLTQINLMRQKIHRPRQGTIKKMMLLMLTTSRVKTNQTKKRRNHRMKQEMITL